MKSFSTFFQRVSTLTNLLLNKMFLTDRIALTFKVFSNTVTGSSWTNVPTLRELNLVFYGFSRELKNIFTTIIILTKGKVPNFFTSPSIIFFLFIFTSISATANISVTTLPTGGTSISADKATNATVPAFTTLSGSIVITEGAIGDIPRNNIGKTFVINAPTGWEFNTSSSLGVSFLANKNITTISISATSSAVITITFTTPNGNNGDNAIDVITITGIQVRPTDGGAIPASNNLALGNGTATIIAGLNGTACGSLSQVVGVMSKLVVSLPGETFTDASTKAASGNSGTVTGQTVGTSFNISQLTATDQFFNVIIAYAGSKTIAYSGPGSSTGGGPTYTTTVSFTTGVSATTLATTLRKAETITISATDAASFGSASSSLVVAGRALTITTPAVTSKTYDGTTSAVITGTLSGRLSGDLVTLSGTGTFNNKNQGTAKAVTSTSTLAGTDAANYVLTQPTGLTGTITTLALTITGAASSKTYDGTTSSATVPTVTPGAIQTGDFAAFTETYNTKNVGSSNVMTPAGVVSDGNGGNNYSYTFVTSSNGIITARALTITAAANTKTYDGTTSAAATPIITGVIQGVDVANFTETYDTKNQGINKVLTPAGTVTDGNSGNNYTYTFATSSTGTINIRALTVTAITNTKTYDGITSAAAKPTITGGIQGVDVANFTETYDTRNVGSNKTLTPAGTVSDGNGGINYSYSFSSITSGVITASAITITAATNTKAFDGTTSAVALPTIPSGALLGSDVANFTETYDTKNVGTGKTLTPLGTVSDGNSGNNYAYTFVTNTTGVINAVALTVTATGPTKTYGTGLSAGTSSANFTAIGTITGETVTSVTLTPNAAGISASTAAGATYTVTPSLATGTGGFLASNYTVTYIAFNGTVIAKGLIITANTQSKNYGTTFTFAGTEFISSGLVNGDVVSSVTLTSSGAASTATVAGSPYPIVPSAATGTGLSNYSISYVNGSLTVSSASQAIADFRSKASGNFSVAGTWEYNPDGVWIIATQVPLTANNINILTGHAIALDQNFTVGAAKTFLISSGGSLNINPNFILDVAGTGTLNFNGQSVTVKSTSAGTGSIGVIAGTLSGATNVTVERFITTPSRAWRLLTIPATTAGKTIRDAWAGGIAPNPNAPSGEVAGNGTLITGPNFGDGASATAAGFDFFTGLGSGTSSSIRFYGSTGGWGNVNTPSMTTVPIQQGYMLYVRGDRTVATTGGAGFTTTLRPNGTIKSGSIPVTLSASPFTLVGNPYAASINLDNMYNTGTNKSVINPTFYIWDATLGTSGAYRTLIKNGPTYIETISGNGLPYLVVNSGQAFFVVPNLGGSLIINESDKTSAAPPTLFRPMGITGSITSQLAIKLYQATGTTLGQQMDGVIARFNDIYNVSPTEVYDAAKINNFNENISLVRNNRYLSVESRPYPTKADTLFVPFWNLQTRDYALTITSKQFAGLNQTAVLMDKFTSTQKVIDLNDTTIIYPFSITSDPASSSLNRFIIVFTPSVPLAVSFTKINASLFGLSKVQVSWNTGSETAVKNYEIEKSSDGNSFGKAGTVVAKNAPAGAAYQWLDDAPVNGNNYYRIRSNDENGKFRYSNVAMVQLNAKKGIQVSPTVISNQHFTLSLNDVAAGNYRLVLTDASGREVYQKIITNAGGYNSQQIDLGKTFKAAGVYNLSVSDAKGNGQNFRLVIKN